MDENQNVEANAESWRAQVGQLSEDAIKLLEEHVRLFKVEMKEEFSAYLRDGMILGLGGLVATVGFALLSSRLPKGTGVVYMLLGGATVLLMTKRISKRSPIPREIAEEIREDRRWLRELA
ncbi:MAG TPA: phage holin family protein [Blastocatellia bacterium]